MNTLPTELLQQILVHLAVDEYLHETAFVCKRWSSVFSDVHFAKRHMRAQVAVVPADQVPVPVAYLTAQLISLFSVESRSLVPASLNVNLKVPPSLVLKCLNMWKEQDAVAWRNTRVDLLFEWLLSFKNEDLVLDLLILCDEVDEVDEGVEALAQVTEAPSVKLCVHFDPATNNNKMIRTLSKRGFSKAASLLLFDERVDPSANANEALRMAALHGHANVVALLMTHPRVDVRAHLGLCSFSATKLGHVNVLKELANHPKADFSNGLLRIAVQESFYSVVEFLLSHPTVNPNELDCSALKVACGDGNLNIVKLLLRDPRINPSID
ncbi:UNVERIFIED_CONTAM: hypothetical protein HDU68_001847 [Siphonaria sp. JEL0065]|nr:hypothetical protein HDU68_001847 [Siphonaria sp. JEL0065]